MTTAGLAFAVRSREEGERAVRRAEEKIKETRIYNIYEIYFFF